MLLIRGQLKNESLFNNKTPIHLMKTLFPQNLKPYLLSSLILFTVSCNSANNNRIKSDRIDGQPNTTEVTTECHDIEEVGTLTNGILAVYGENCAYFVDTSCSKLYGQVYHHVGDFRPNGTALIEKMVNGQSHSFIIDTTGKELLSIDPSYLKVYHDPSGEYLEVSPNKWTDAIKKNGLLSIDGESIIPIDHGSIYLSDRWAVVDIRMEKCKFIELETGNVVTTHDGQYGSFSEGFVSIMADQHYFIDSTGKNPFHTSFYWSDDFKEGLAKVTNRSDIWFINTEGEKAFERTFNYESLDHFQSGFSEGLCPILIKDEWHIIDPTGITQFKVQYDDVWEFEKGYAIIEHQGLFGLIDKKGNEVFPPENEYIIEPVYEGLFLRFDAIDRAHLIDKKGNAYPMTFQNISNFENGVAIGIVNGQLKSVYLKEVCKTLNVDY